MNGFRRATLVVLLACAGSVAMWARREWGFVLMVSRFLRLGPPPTIHAPWYCEKLIETMPADVLERLVLVSVQPKMGTSWLGHMVHELVAHGRTNHSRNLQVDSPYPEFATVFGSALHEETPPYWERAPFSLYPKGPVTVRTHAAVGALAARGFGHHRMMTVVRDPADTMLSAWRFVPGVAAVDHKDVKLELMVGFFRVNGILKDMHTDYAEWWERRHDDNALLLFYDDLKEDLPREVRRIAAHLRLDPAPTEAELATVAAQSTLSWMSDPAHSARFNNPPDLMAKMRRSMWIEHLKNEVNVVQKNGGKSGQKVPPGVRATLDALWAAHVYPRTNCSSLDEMRRRFAEERRARVT